MGLYLGTRKCPHCRVRRTMEYDEDRDIIRCAGCRREVPAPASALPEEVKARLAACAVRYQQRTGTNLRTRRELGVLRRGGEDDPGTVGEGVYRIEFRDLDAPPDLSPPGD